MQEHVQEAFRFVKEDLVSDEDKLVQTSKQMKIF